MKDRLLTLALALGALAAFYVLLVPKPAPPQERVTRPVSTEAGPNGYLAMQRWFAAEHLPTLSLRERYRRLAEVSGGTRSGNLLISTAPHIYPPRASEVDALSDWIAAGNTLLVLAGLSDTPEWSHGEGQDPGFLGNLQRMTGLKFIDATPATAEAGEQSQGAARQMPRNALEAFRRLAQPQRFESIPNGSHPLLQGVQSIVAVSEYPSTLWRATSASPVLLELTVERASGVPALWLVRHGEGQIIVSAFGSIFTNKVLGEHDNARLLANLARWSLGRGGRVIIDDAHQGLVSFYDPAKFFGDSRLHRSLWWLLALWLVFVLGPRRLCPAVGSWNPIDVTSFVRATGGFMARVLRPAAASERLFENFFNEIRARLGLVADGTPLWEWLGTHTAVAADDLQRMQALHRRLAQRRRVDLQELHNLLVRVRALLN